MVDPIVRMQLIAKSKSLVRSGPTSGAGTGHGGPRPKNRASLGSWGDVVTTERSGTFRG